MTEASMMQFKKLLIREITNLEPSESDLKNFTNVFNTHEVNDYFKWENEKPTLYLWLKSRLFEPTLACIGTDKYIEELLKYNGDKPEKEVKINAFLGSVYLSTSINRFIFEILKKVSVRKNIINSAQLLALSEIYNPRKDFKVITQDVYFEPDQLEDIREVLLRTSLDMLSIYDRTQGYLVPEMKIAYDESIPKEIVRIGPISSFEFDQLLYISQIVGHALKISLIDGYVIWKFRDEPTIYLKAGSAFFAPNRSKYSKTSEKKMAERQLFLIEEKLESVRKSPTVLCSLCNDRFTSTIMYHRQKGAVPVCERCAADSQVIAKVATLSNK